MISECNCKSPDTLEDGNCICTDCNCHYFIEKDEWLQNKLRNYGMVILGTSTALYGIYLFCCEKHLSYFVV